MSTMPALILAAIVAATGIDPYDRSRTADGKHCLWWSAGSVVYSQSELGNPNGATPFDAVTASWQSWQAIQSGCGNLTLSEGPRLPGPIPGRIVGYDQGSNDNYNVVMFRQRLCSIAAPPGDPCFSNQNCNNQYDCWGNASGTIGLTTTTYRVSTGEILDADIEFNAATFHFTTLQSGCACGSGHTGCNATDIQNTATHEFGHSLGLDHTNYCDGGVCSVMNPNSCAGEISKRTIDPWSSAFVCDVYPKGRASLDCISSAASSVSASKTGCTSAPGPFAWPLLALLVLGLRARRSSELH